MTQAGAGTVYVIDDDDAVRESLVFLLSVEGWQVQGFASIQAFLAARPVRARGCIITDMRMPELGGADLLRLLPEQQVHLPVIVITGQGDVATAVQVLAEGAFDFIEKPFQDSAILQSVRAALATGQPDPADQASARVTSGIIAQLSDRERVVLDHLVRGVPNRAIAGVLGTDVRDIELVRARIMERIGASSLAALIRKVAATRRQSDHTNGSL